MKRAETGLAIESESEQMNHDEAGNVLTQSVHTKTGATTITETIA